jgi:hypothetical protein
MLMTLPLKPSWLVLACFVNLKHDQFALKLIFVLKLVLHFAKAPYPNLSHNPPFNSIDNIYQLLISLDFYFIKYLIHHLDISYR